jgi:hypothetical protein
MASRPQPLISVTDVPRSSRWYQELFDFESGHGGGDYERLLCDGTLVLQLHRFDVEHHHGRIGDALSRPYGNGLRSGSKSTTSTMPSFAQRRSTRR